MQIQQGMETLRNTAPGLMNSMTTAGLRTTQNETNSATGTSDLSTGNDGNAATPLNPTTNSDTFSEVI